LFGFLEIGNLSWVGGSGEEEEEGEEEEREMGFFSWE
jgi:hypothetical protein